MRFVHPQLPDFLDAVELRNLRLGASELDVLLHRRNSSVAASVARKTGAVKVEVVL